ncbi:hypothetical protein VTK73DRAFT_9518 [Phialemonium thermophilum]|uniref:Bromodomain associated domain-containing protein n=1 Tax=Phialemonium thermophilum TaxID=223376 RepID=A0ABR3Y5E0_9PEZI
MTPPQTLFHSLLRPSILQILRAAGYHSAKTAVLDSLTDLAARYLFEICHITALYAAQNGSESGEPCVTDVRMALQYVGALLPEKLDEEQEFLGYEDMRGIDEFVAWASGPVNREIRRIALDGVEEATDYLTALKKKHGKTNEDSKFTGTLLGKCNEHSDVRVEGGEYPTIQTWVEKMRKDTQRSVLVETRADTGDDDREGSRSPSSGLSSLGDRSIGDYEMADY